VVPPKTTAPDASPAEQWTPTPPPLPETATPAATEAYLRQAALDLTRGLHSAAQDLAMVSPTAGVVMAQRAEPASRGLVSLGRLLPGGTTGMAGIRIARDAWSVLTFLAATGIAALVDMGRIDPGGRVAQRTGVTQAYLHVQQQLEAQRAQLAALSAPTTAAWGGYAPQPAQAAAVSPQDLAALQAQAQAQNWALMQAQAAMQAAQGPAGTVFRRNVPGW